MTEVEQKHLRQQIKKRIDAGLFWPAASGGLISYCDKEEYLQSKAIKGFVWQMPIALHIRGTGAGEYEEFITRYLSINEAKALALQLMALVYDLEPQEKPGTGKFQNFWGGK